MKKIFVVLLVVSAMCTACMDKETELTFQFNLVDYSWLQDTIPSESPLRLHVNARSLSSQIKHIVITSFDDKYQIQGVLDTVFQDPLKTADFDFIWPLKNYMELTTVSLKGYAYSTGGDQMVYAMAIRVGADTRKLDPYDNITLYSAASGRKSGFSMVDLETVYPDSERRDSLVFYDEMPEVPQATEENPNPEVPDVMRCTWYSTSGVYFARFESFDYAQATARKVIEAYGNSKRYPKIEGIHNDDILLVGTADKPLGVIKVILVSDEEGVANDRYIFSLKALSQGK